MIRDQFVKRLEEEGFNHLQEFGGENWRQYCRHKPNCDDHILLHCQMNLKYDFFLDCETNALRPFDELEDYLVQLGIVQKECAHTHRRFDYDGKEYCQACNKVFEFDAHEYLIEKGWDALTYDPLHVNYILGNFGIWFSLSPWGYYAKVVLTCKENGTIRSFYSHNQKVIDKQSIDKAISLIEFLIKLEG